MKKIMFQVNEIIDLISSDKDNSGWGSFYSVLVETDEKRKPEERIFHKKNQVTGEMNIPPSRRKISGLVGFLRRINVVKSDRIELSDEFEKLSRKGIQNESVLQDLIKKYLSVNDIRDMDDLKKNIDKIQYPKLRTAAEIFDKFQNNKKKKDFNIDRNDFSKILKILALTGNIASRSALLYRVDK